MHWIDVAVDEGAELVLDGRDLVVPGLEDGHFVGPTIFDHVTPEMSCGWEEAFGPVLFIKRVADFEEGLALMNHSAFANGSCIFTESGYYSREFARRTHAGMVGINVGIPVPVSFFPFSGHKDSFFGDNHVLGKDGVQLLHRDQVRHHALVHGGRQEAEAGQHLGGHRQPLSTEQGRAPSALGRASGSRPRAHLRYPWSGDAAGTTSGSVAPYVRESKGSR